MAHASVASNESKVDLDSHADTCLVGDNCLVIHNHNRPLNVYSCNLRDGHRNAKTLILKYGIKIHRMGGSLS